MCGLVLRLIDFVFFSPPVYHNLGASVLRLESGLAQQWRFTLATIGPNSLLNDALSQPISSVLVMKLILTI